MIDIICKTCGKLFQNYESNHKKFCSRKCYYKSKLGNIPWNKGTKGVMRAWNKGLKGFGANRIRTKEWCNRISKAKWKGENIGYYRLHSWVNECLGKANKCSKDLGHKSPRYHWANISGEYKRDLTDWHELCPSCNKKDGVRKHKRFL